MRMQFDEFQGRTAIVTGAASGMGLLCAQRLAENGAKVVLADANLDGAQQAAATILRAGGQAAAQQADVRFYEQAQAVAEHALTRYGSVDILINCAGGYGPRILKTDGYFPTMPPDVIDWDIDVNLKGPLHFARAVMMPMIRQRRGVIINVGSTCGSAGHSGLAYATAKSGVMNGLTKSLAQYGAKYGVRCCCVTPGPVLTRQAMANMPTLLGYAAEPQEVVDLILYLCSDSARSMTGAEYLVDGGRSATSLDAAGYGCPPYPSNEKERPK